MPFCFAFCGLQLPVDIESMTETVADMILGLGGFVLVYSVTNLASFKRAKKLKVLVDEWLLSRNLTNQVPIALVANKADLEAERVVTTQEGYRAAESFNFQRFHEISARSGFQQVERVFVELLQCMRAARKGEGLAKLEMHLQKAPTFVRSLSPSHFGSIPEIRGDDIQFNGDSETNTLKKFFSSLRTFNFISPVTSPSTSPKTSPRTSPRSSPRSSTVLTPHSAPAASPRMARRKTLPGIFTPGRV